ncbi:MAG: tRNA epoxyqueuosine(34) reductase QueG [Ignavibacteria bacterium]|nr:tRNA epoxyqueuosine(34) reductase QueG [Ignavibacteria bacterium]
MHTENITGRIKQAAIDIGFSSVKITDAVPLSEEIERYQQWLELGFHGTMSYLERNLEKRENLSQVLPEACSVIVVTQNYYTPHNHELQRYLPDQFGKISRYAWGDDYHDIMKSKLLELSRISDLLTPGSTSKVYTDTGPIMEKAWAVRAGIGWQGKHSNIISRTHGSWFFIGVIITTAQLLTDEPIVDYCGTCTACIDACPTSAIVEPYVVDATKCLSYWTIETKPEVEIPLEIAKSMDGWIFGCDTCQDVCPWNSFKIDTSEKRFEPREEETCLEFQAIEAFTQDNFSSRFKNSPIKRTKLAGLQRNVIAVNSPKLNP